MILDVAVHLTAASHIDSPRLMGVTMSALRTRFPTVRREAEEEGEKEALEEEGADQGGEEEGDDEDEEGDEGTVDAGDSGKLKRKQAPANITRQSHVPRSKRAERPTKRQQQEEGEAHGKESVGARRSKFAPGLDLSHLHPDVRRSGRSFLAK